MRLNLWSPLPPSPSGIADYVAEALPLLAGRFELTVIVEDAEAVDPTAAGGGLWTLRTPATAPEADLDLYEIGNSPAHAPAYRAALARPGVVALHEWSLHHLVLHETVERGDVPRISARCAAPTARPGPSWAARWRGPWEATSSPPSSR